MRFYGGGDPLAWLKQPQCLLRAVAGLIPKLQAEEALDDVARVGVGTGSMEKKDQKQLVRTWQALTASPDAEPRKPHFNAAALSSIGVKVQTS